MTTLWDGREFGRFVPAAVAQVMLRHIRSARCVRDGGFAYEIIDRVCNSKNERINCKAWFREARNAEI